MEEEITHDHVVQVLLVSMVALVYNKQADLRHLDETMNQKVIELLGHHHEHVTYGHL